MNRAECREIGKDCVWKYDNVSKQYDKSAGWFGEMDRVFSNDQYSVMIRTVMTDWGLVEHAAIQNVDGADIPWREKQRIKNELFGEERIAVEVFPKESELVDEAPMYHLWILPVGVNLPFGIY